MATNAVINVTVCCSVVDVLGNALSEVSRPIFFPLQELFLIKVTGCAEEPKNCDGIKAETRAVHDETLWSIGVLWSARDLNTEINNDEVEDHQEGSAAIAARAPKRLEARPAPPINSCGLCTMAINACTKQCKTPGACDDACNCHQKVKNPHCSTCSIKCNCGHNCPTQDMKLRRDDELLEDGQLESDSNADVETKENDTVVKDNDSAVSTGDGGGPPTGPLFPLPNPQHKACTEVLNYCLGQCNKPGLCDDACYCHIQKVCGMKTPCKCSGHVCPRVAALGHDPKEIPDMEIREDTDLELAGGIPPPPNPMMRSCMHELDWCLSQCNRKGACDDACHCYASRICQMKMPCKCKGHLCANVHALGDRLEESVSTNTLETKPEAAAKRDTLIPVPIADCVLCTMAINTCKQKCNTPGACDEACACHHKAKNVRCRECKIKCNCGHQCGNVLEQGRQEGAF